MYKPRINVLHIDDAPQKHRAFHTELARRNIYAHTVATLQEAKRVLTLCIMVWEIRTGIMDSLPPNFHL